MYKQISKYPLRDDVDISAVQYSSFYSSEIDIPYRIQYFKVDSFPEKYDLIGVSLFSTEEGKKVADIDFSRHNELHISSYTQKDPQEKYTRIFDDKMNLVGVQTGDLFYTDADAEELLKRAFPDFKSPEMMGLCASKILLEKFKAGVEQNFEKNPNIIYDSAEKRDSIFIHNNGNIVASEEFTNLIRRIQPSQKGIFVFNIGCDGSGSHTAVLALERNHEGKRRFTLFDSNGKRGNYFTFNTLTEKVWKNILLHTVEDSLNNCEFVFNEVPIQGQESTCSFFAATISKELFSLMHQEKSVFNLVSSSNNALKQKEIGEVCEFWSKVSDKSAINFGVKINPFCRRFLDKIQANHQNHDYILSNPKHLAYFQNKEKNKTSEKEIITQNI